VVAAAGNAGYQIASAGTAGSVSTSKGTGFETISITDPGNAEEAITVGATHGDHPYRYGTSFFSGKGPTADGRPKPDLLAPGEHIYGPVGDGGYDSLLGTSQAAPHVSGAAALLMARYPELIGEPQRVKDILCRTASDLGRDRLFQGHGLVDVLRAMQSV
jgi:subtilisin family serine protease